MILSLERSMFPFCHQFQVDFPLRIFTSSLLFFILISCKTMYCGVTGVPSKLKASFLRIDRSSKFLSPILQSTYTTQSRCWKVKQTQNVKEISFVCIKNSAVHNSLNKLEQSLWVAWQEGQWTFQTNHQETTTAICRRKKREKENP